MFSKLVYRVNPQAAIGERLWVEARESVKKGELLLKELPFEAVHAVKCADPTNKLPSMIYAKSSYFGDEPLEGALLTKLRRSGRLDAYKKMRGMSDASDVDMMKNSIYLNTLPGISVTYGAALYEKLVYFNHACAPAAEISFGRAQSVCVTALRDIRAGEEVRIAYVPFVRGDCAAFYGEYKMPQMDFVCECEMCETVREAQAIKQPRRDSLFCFTLPDLEASTQQEVMQVKILQRCVIQLMHNLHDQMNASSNYRVAQLMMRQGTAWRQFCERASGPMLVYMGLNLARCALIAFKSETVRTMRDRIYPGSGSFLALNDFWQKWLVLLSSKSCGDGAPSTYRYGILLHALFAKFFRMAINGKQRDFFMMLQRLTLFMRNEAFMQQGDYVLEILDFHLDVLGWSDMLRVAEKIIDTTE